VERIIAAVCRRKGVQGAEAEDFASIVKMHLLEDDYRVLREFRGQARLTTFLTTVIHNQLRDFRIRKWGRWRPSAAARRLGTVAVQLETQILRDGLTLEEAIQTLRHNFQVEETEAELEELAAQLPVRHQRYFTSDEVLQWAAAPAAPDPVEEGERQAQAETVQRALVEVLREVDEEDRLILRLRFEEGLMVSRIAPLLDLDQKALYRRIYGLLKALKEALERRGVTWAEAAEALDWKRGEMGITDDDDEKED
jgi:RNA polymerase sigma factor for flagellar operon FliA